ncbi:MAG: hypothetical protein IIZ67_02185 [Bacilli bacterium]|nr:hypothetical protein [Bacilli bacterium]
MDIQNRVVNFYKNNQFSHSYMLGIDPVTNNAIIGFNGKTKRVSIDVLESFKTEEDIRNYIEDKVILKENNISDTLPEFDLGNSVNEVTVTPVVQKESVITNNYAQVKENLNDIKILNELKNKDGLDNILKKFAVNESTGLIDINKAISVVTRNTMNEVEKAIRNKYEFDTDFSNYDIDGKYIGSSNIGTSTDDEKIFSSFKNIKLYLDAAKMYPDQANYTDEQINVFMRTYISKVKEELYGNENSVKNEVIDSAIPPVVNSVNEDVSSNKSAGFADIFVLTVIVLVYAVIIVNLILKLN